MALKGRAFTRFFHNKFFLTKFLAVQDLGHSELRAHLERALEILSSERELWKYSERALEILNSERELWKYSL